MNLDIKGVISNHETHKEIVESNGVNFHYLPMNKDSKKERILLIERIDKASKIKEIKEYTSY